MNGLRMLDGALIATRLEAGLDTRPAGRPDWHWTLDTELWHPYWYYHYQ